MKGEFLKKTSSLLSNHIFFQLCVNSIFHVGVGLLLTKLPAFEETGYGHLMLNYDHSIWWLFVQFFYRCRRSIFITRQWSCGKVMFSGVSFHQSFCLQGDPGTGPRSPLYRAFAPHPTPKLVRLRPYCTEPCPQLPQLPDTFKHVYYEALTVGPKDFLLRLLSQKFGAKQI